MTAQQVAEAIRIGPANMPRFSGNLTDPQVADIVSYVTGRCSTRRTPAAPGSAGSGRWPRASSPCCIGVGGLALICFWIGERS